MLASFNWVDYTILGIFGISTLLGLSRGFVKETISLIALIAAFIVATMFAQPIASIFTHTSSVQTAVGHTSEAMKTDTTATVGYVAIACAYAILFVGTILIGAIIGFIFNIAIQATTLSFGNRLLGACFGLARGFIFNVVLIFLVQLTAFGAEGAWKNSRLVPYFQPTVNWLSSVVSPTLANLKERFGSTLQNANSAMQRISTPTVPGGEKQGN